MTDGNDDPHALRARPRRKLFQLAELEVGCGRRRIHLLDLSETGALINAAEPPAEGSFVTLLCGSLQRSARVAWVRDKRLGIRFVMPLTVVQVNEVLSLGAGQRTVTGGG